MKQFLAAVMLTALGAIRPALGPAATVPTEAPAPAPGGSWIEWDRASERIVSAPGDAGAAYPRAKQLSNGEILLAYHAGGGLGDFGAWVTLRRSRDGGATWYQTQRIDGPSERGFFGFCNADFIELGGGRVMLVCAARGRALPYARDGFVSECQHGGLRVRFSNDYGSTWGPPRMIAGGRGRLWEPSIARLPGGELQIFYANESADLQVEGSRQCIESIRSQDDGKTWSAPVVVSEDPGCRNGMPAALTLGNGHVVCVQEVVGLKTSPWIADTVRGRTGGYHLAQNKYDFGAAPFLARAPDGGTLLAFHSQYLQTPEFKRVPMSWMFSHIYVQHGDADADNFGVASCPWPEIGANTGSFFPSLMVMNGGTLVAMASFITVHPDRTTSTVVHWIKGKMTGSPVKSLPGKLVAVPPSTTAQATVLTEPVTASSATPSPVRKAEYRYGPPPGDEEVRPSAAGY